MANTESGTLPKIKPLTVLNYHTWKLEIKYVLMEKDYWEVVSGVRLFREERDVRLIQN